MKGLVVSFRRGRHTMYNNQILIEVNGIKNRKEASKLIGKKVIWRTEGGKIFRGVITSPHGNKGRVRARFEKGLPGQILGKKVDIV